MIYPGDIDRLIYPGNIMPELRCFHETAKCRHIYRLRGRPALQYRPLCRGRPRHAGVAGRPPALDPSSSATPPAARSIWTCAAASDEIVARLPHAPDPAAAADETAAAEPRGRGRPKLGVVAREVTLLPRHWEWLAHNPAARRWRCASWWTRPAAPAAIATACAPRRMPPITSCPRWPAISPISRKLPRAVRRRPATFRRTDRRNGRPICATTSSSSPTAIAAEDRRRAGDRVDPVSCARSPLG